jgi:predicted  nucleic acid-binding Zn-ribbon protein
VDIDYEKLIILQKLDSEIRQVSLFLESTPKKIEDIDKKVEHSSQTASQAKEKLAQNQKRRRELESQVKDVKIHISKYKIQLNEVKTNKEYTALLHEIEEDQKKIDKLEEAIISEMLAADDIEKEIREANLSFNRDQENFNKEKELIYQKKRELEERIKKLQQDRETILPQIPQDQLRLYLQIYRKMGGISLSPVTDDFCSMCHMRIRPQVLNELIEAKKLTLCEACSRILYWKQKPEAEEPKEASGETKPARSV